MTDGERERERQALGNLLAVIHRDGGHYQAEHGSKKAAEDAETLVCWLRDNVERLESQVRELTAQREKDDKLFDRLRIDNLNLEAHKDCAGREVAELRATVEKLTGERNTWQHIAQGFEKNANEALCLLSDMRKGSL